MNRIAQHTALMTLTLAAACAVAPAATISEIAPSGADGSPPYLEITITQPVASIQVMVLDARPDREQRVFADVSVAVDPFTAVVMLHESGWSNPTPFQSQFVAVDDLGLGGEAVGASRRLVVFDASDGLAAGPTVPPLADWASTADMPAILDVVSYTINGWPARAALDEPLIALAGNESAIRMLSGPGFSDAFGHAPASPGWINSAAPAPEPTGALMMWIGGLWLLRSRSSGLKAGFMAPAPPHLAGRRRKNQIFAKCPCARTG